jgi:hypothetical protein
MPKLDSKLHPSLSKLSKVFGIGPIPVNGFVGLAMGNDGMATNYGNMPVCISPRRKGYKTMNIVKFGEKA